MMRGPINLRFSEVVAPQKEEEEEDTETAREIL
jgi:hypothetical protein